MVVVPPMLAPPDVGILELPPGNVGLVVGAAEVVSAVVGFFEPPPAVGAPAGVLPPVTPPVIEGDAVDTVVGFLVLPPIPVDPPTVVPPVVSPPAVGLLVGLPRLPLTVVAFLVLPPEAVGVAAEAPIVVGLLVLLPALVGLKVVGVAVVALSDDFELLPVVGPLEVGVAVVGAFLVLAPRVAGIPVV